jgi:hypothetical protein
MMMMLLEGVVACKMLFHCMKWCTVIHLMCGASEIVIVFHLSRSANPDHMDQVGLWSGVRKEVVDQQLLRAEYSFPSLRSAVQSYFLFAEEAD